MTLLIPEYRSPEDPIGAIGTVGEFWRWAMSDLLNNRIRQPVTALLNLPV